MNKEIVRRKLSELKPHPKNSLIYGQNEDISDLKAQIEETGRIDPLFVNSNDEILAGHRRRLVCLELGIEEVDTILTDFPSAEDEFKFLLSNNATRPKSNEQKIREGLAWEEILSKEAKQRSAANLKSNNAEVQESAPQGKTRDRVAKLCNLGSGDTYRKGKAIVQAMDAYIGSGAAFEASQLKEALGDSIEAAHKSLKGFQEASSDLQSGVDKIYTYQGREQLIGIKTNLEPGMKVLVASTIVASDPNRVYIRLESDHGETFQVLRSDLQMQVAVSQGMWRDRQDLILCTVQPTSQMEAMYIRVDGLETEEQIAYSVTAESILIGKRDTLNGQLMTANKKDKSSINRQLDMIAKDLATEQALQQQLRTEKFFDVAKVREHKEKIRLWMQSLITKKGEQLLPGKKRNEGDPQSLVDATPPAPMIEFVVGDRVSAKGESALGTVVNVDRSGVVVSFDNYNRSALAIAKLHTLTKITTQKEWRTFQEFTRRASKQPGDIFKIEFDPEPPSSGMFTKFHVSELGSKEINTYVVQDSEVEQFIVDGVRPVAVGQKYADMYYSYLQNQNKESADAVDVVLDANPDQIEPDGQTTLIYDTSNEPPEPDDFASVEEYEKALAIWEEKHSGNDDEADDMDEENNKQVEGKADTPSETQASADEAIPAAKGDTSVTTRGGGATPSNKKNKKSDNPQTITEAIQVFFKHPLKDLMQAGLEGSVIDDEAFYSAIGQISASKWIEYIKQAYENGNIKTAIIRLPLESSVFFKFFCIVILADKWGRNECLVYLGDKRDEFRKTMDGGGFGVAISRM